MVTPKRSKVKDGKKVKGKLILVLQTFMEDFWIIGKAAHAEKGQTSTPAFLDYLLILLFFNITIYYPCFCTITPKVIFTTYCKAPDYKAVERRDLLSQYCPE